MSQDIAPLNLPDLGSAESISVERLVLDENNSRLVTDDGSASDEAIIAQLYRGADLSELLLSIAANGYLDIEPLIVVEEGERIVVLEGNRRLAAIRLFREPELARKIVDSQRLRITVPDISDEHRATLDCVSVYRVAQPERCPFLYRLQAHKRGCQMGVICKGQIRSRLVSGRRNTARRYCEPQIGDRA